MKVRKAVITAAGLGTRVLPATKSVPKEMIFVADKPAIQYIVEECAAAGITDILITLTVRPSLRQNLNRRARQSFSSR